MPYGPFYWIHVVSYIAWLLAFVVSLVMLFRIRSGGPAQEVRSMMKTERLATSIGAHLGALGILISGGAMASIPSGPQYGWFTFSGDLAWLGVKQVLFLVILVLVVLSIRRGRAFKAALATEAEGELGQETVRKWTRAYALSFSVYMLVLINTVLGLTKPF